MIEKYAIKSCALIDSDDITCYLGFGTLSNSGKTEVFGDNAVLLIGDKLYFWNKPSESANEIIQTEENKDDIQELKTYFKKVQKDENGLYPLTESNRALELITKLTDTVPLSEAFIKLAQARRIYRVLVYGENKHYPEDYKQQITSLSEEIPKLAKAAFYGFIHEMIKQAKAENILIGVEQDHLVKIILESYAENIIENILKDDPQGFNSKLDIFFTTVFSNCNLKDEQLIKFKTNLFQSPLTQYSAGCEILSSTNQIGKTCKEIRDMKIRQDQPNHVSQISKLASFYSAFNETTLANNASIKNRQFSQEEIEEYDNLFKKIFERKFDPIHTPILTAFSQLNTLKPFYLFNESDIIKLFSGNFISYFVAINNDNETFKKTVDILIKATLALKPLEEIYKQIQNIKLIENQRNFLKKILLGQNTDILDPQDEKKLMIFIEKLTVFYQVMPRIIMPLTELHKKVVQEKNVKNKITESPVEKNVQNKLTENPFENNPEQSIFVPFNIEEILQNQSREEVTLSDVNDLSDSLDIVSKYCEKLNLFKACADYVYKIDKLLKTQKNNSNEYTLLQDIHRFLNNNSNYCNNKTDDLGLIFNQIVSLADKYNIIISEEKKEEYQDQYMVLIHEIYHDYKERCIKNNIPLKEQKKKNISTEITPQVPKIQTQLTASINQTKKKIIDESGDNLHDQDRSSPRLTSLNNQIPTIEIPTNQVPIDQNKQHDLNSELEVPKIENEKTPYIDRLNLYIKKIEELPKIGNTQQINFKAGFHIAWNQRAKSRKTNYETAIKLRVELLDPNKSLKDVFKETNIYNLRSQTSAGPGMFGKKIHGRLKDIKDAVEKGDPNYKSIK